MPAEPTFDAWLSDLARTAADAAKTAVQAEWSAVLLPLRGTSEFVTAADTRPDPPFLRVSLSSTTAEFLARDQGLLRTSRPGTDAANLLEAGATIAAPILSAGILNGLIVTGPGVAGETFPVSHLNFLVALGRFAGSALEAAFEQGWSEAA